MCIADCSHHEGLHFVPYKRCHLIIKVIGTPGRPSFVCNGCGSPFPAKRPWQKQYSGRSQQRAYVQRRPIRIEFYFGA